MDRNAGRIAIVAALEREVWPLVKGWRVVHGKPDGWPFKFFEHDRVVVVCGGIGGDAARRAAEGVIARYTPVAIYSAGFAGALTPEMKIGHVLHPSCIVNVSDGSRVTLEVGDGVLVTFAAIASPEQKKKLQEAYAAQSVDMEAAAVAQAAEARGVKFAAIKVISDESDFVFPSMERFVSGGGQFSEWRFGAFVALRPWLWPRVVRLARNSGRASRVLCETLAKIVEDSQATA